MTLALTVPDPPLAESANSPAVFGWTVRPVQSRRTAGAEAEGSDSMTKRSPAANGTDPAVLEQVSPVSEMVHVMAASSAQVGSHNRRVTA